MKVLTQMIRSLFGLSGTSSSESETEQESDITVEREPDTKSEDAVKGTETATEDTETAAVEEDADETESVEETNEPVTEEADEETATADEEVAAEEEPEPEESAAGSESVEEISGIGPTYSDRLGEAGLGTVGALADSDAETAAEAAQTSESRAQDWIDSANDRL